MTRLRRPSSPVVVLSLALAGAAVFFLVLARGLWFYGDEWSFLLHRRVTLASGVGVFEPHNEHWTTIPLLVYRAMYAVFGLRHFGAFAVLPVAVHVLICVLLHLRLRRSGVPPWHSVLAVVVLAFLGTGAENLLWPFQITFLGSAAAGMGALLALDARTSDRNRWLLVWVALTVSLMCSGMSLPMVVWVGALALLTRGLVFALVATVPPALVFLGWYLAFAGDTVAQAPGTDLGEFATFLWVAAGRIWTPSHAALSLAFLALLVLVTLTARVQPPLRALAVSGLLAAVSTYVMLGLSRGGLGRDAALAGRYVYFGVLMTLPAFAVLTVTVARVLGDRPAVRAVLGGTVALLLVASGCAQAVLFRDSRGDLIGDLRARTVASAELVRSGEPLLSDQVDPLYAEPLDLASLRRPSVQDALPRLDPGPQSRWNARAALHVVASPEPLPLPVATDVVDQRGLEDQTRSGDCVRAVARPGARVVVRGGAGGVQLPMTVSGDTVVTALTDAQGRRSTSIARKVEAGEDVWVGTSVPDTRLTIIVRGGPVTFCTGGVRR